MRGEGAGNDRTGCQGARAERREWKWKSWGQASPLGSASLKERKSVIDPGIALSLLKTEQKEVQCKAVG